MDHTVIEFGWNAAFFSGIFSIILIDILLSGDNSIVIALAVRTLPPQKRLLGLLAGVGAAAGLRIGFTFIASHLMQVPYLKLVGGFLLLWIAVKLLSENEDPNPKHRQAHGLLHAMWIIVVADVTMSLDNILAVAGASRGSPLLLWMGLGLSIPLVMFASTLLSKLMDRFPIIVIIGAMVLGKVAADMITGDPVIFKYVAHIPHIHIYSQAIGMGAILLLGLRNKLRRSTKASAISGQG